MIDQLPEGISIGWMQAPPQWIFTHTARFVGIVRIIIQDGEGFILIRKGKPLKYYFEHDRIELRGQAALDYFNSQPAIEFTLCKYTPEELSDALKICIVEDTLPRTRYGQKPALPKPVRAEVIVRREQGAGSPLPGHPRARVVERPEILKPDSEAVPAAEKPQEKPLVPQPVVLEEPEITIISQIKKLNGIVAISVFNDEQNILLMGDVEIEPLLKIARSMLATTTQITPHLNWGLLVHMTLQIPEGNVIIAPYHENHLCILTTRTINIGHIRRILRDLQQERCQGVMV